MLLDETWETVFDLVVIFSLRSQTTIDSHEYAEIVRTVMLIDTFQLEESRQQFPFLIQALYLSHFRVRQALLDADHNLDPVHSQNCLDFVY